MGCSLPTSSTAKVEVTRGIAGIDLRKILRRISFVACSSGYLLALITTKGLDIH
jgi:hypothetical protein